MLKTVKSTPKKVTKVAEIENEVAAIKKQKLEDLSDEMLFKKMNDLIGEDEPSEVVSETKGKFNFCRKIFIKV